MDVVVALTGHRPKDLGGYAPNPVAIAVYAAMREHLIQLRPTLAYSGMAQGVDQWGVDLCIQLGVPFIAAVPFQGQELKWPFKRDRDRYHELLSQAREVKVVCPGGYDGYKMQLRNEWMVNRCTHLLAVWNGKKHGGTYNCLKFARDECTRKPTIVIIDPAQTLPQLSLNL